MSAYVNAGILTGQEIWNAYACKKIGITPFDPKQVNQASYDLRLGRKFAVYNALGDHSAYVQLDAAKDNPVSHRELPSDGLFLTPGVLYLMHTEEVISTGPYVGVVDGKSSIGRLGIFCHVTAGYFDPGFEGQGTLEVVVVHPVRVYPGMRFAQIRFHTTCGKVESYQKRGHYTGGLAGGPIPSMAWKQIEEDGLLRKKETCDE